MTREDVIREVLNIEKFNYTLAPKETFEVIIEALLQEPVQHAYKILDEDGNMECSNCRSAECWGNYCMNCGAKMDGVEK